ncbi:type I restriction-modification system subunit M [Flavobacterium magnum]|uniref:site-specific DNA-methyltransferase (adenine-specific) n=1 Tax=Flavobacterium magnum TaxID=2162713 RepID=A0A2S0RE59_9FLAO|nr:type I restriction-modification system subunit M [Flavobacterium magnum]AWA29905.1 type I restriction-modification system subunit M [Flavobacterium magnum]
MSDEQKKLLESQLWNIANILRGKINANQFQDYVLGFIFYKYLSEKMEKYANEILRPDHIEYTAINEDTQNEYIEAVKHAAVEKLGFFLKPSDLFSSLAAKGNAKKAQDGDDDESEETFILEDLERILKNIEKSTMGAESEEDFDNLFYDIDLNSTKIGRTVSDRNKVIVKIITALNAIDFDLDNTEGDVLGDAYEYLIGQFAAGAGQKAGEFYTPQAVSSILAKIVTTGKSRLKSVYDPTCGSGSLLLRVAKEVGEVAHFYGQEQNRTTYNLARMNMILHNVSYHDFTIRHEDTLERPQHLDYKFEAIVANPPFSAQWSANPLFMNDERFSQYGRLAPKTKADFAFIQHMVHQLDDNGIMACIAPHGVLFRGAAEGHIRKYLIEDRNYVDAIIGLPANLFYGTSIPTCILVLKKCREFPDDILFIDGSKEFEKVKNQNVLRGEHIDKIADTYRDRAVVDKFSAVAKLESIKANDYNLNIPRYVNTFEEAESIDINAVALELKALDRAIAETDQTIAAFCTELGINTPF